MAGNEKLQELEQSLINFLLRRRDIEEKVTGGIRRVKSLNLKIDTKNPEHITFIVQIGMMEAKFNIKDGLKEQGNCYGIDRYIRDWYTQPSVKVDMQEAIFGTGKQQQKQEEQEERIELLKQKLRKMQDQE